MKHLKIYSILGLSALLVIGACKKDEITSDDGSPVITLSQDTLTVSVEGGVASVAYEVSNPVDGASVSVDLGEVSWITNVDVAESTSTINLTVEANSEGNSRTASLTVSYPGAEDVSLTVVQETDGVQYDYNYGDLADFTGYLYGDEGDHEEDMFYIWLSNIGFDDEGYTQAGGHYYNLVLLVEETDRKTLPTGTYTYTSEYYGDMVLSGVSSRYVEQNEDDDSSFIAYLTDGSITVSAEGDTYTIQGVVTDANGKVHRISYTGPADVFSYILDDVEFEATTVIAEYYTRDNDLMNVDLYFSNRYYDSEGDYFYGPGIHMRLDTYMPYDANGKITPGTYEVSDVYEGTTFIYPDYYSYIYNFSTYSTLTDYSYGTIHSGTMTIEETGTDYYRISCDFETEDGASVKCTYTGYLVVEKMPEPDSTLENDYILDLEGAVATVSNYGDSYYNGGTNLYVEIMPNGAGDALQIDLNAQSGSTVPSGTYTASTSWYPAVGEYLYGYSYYSGYWIYGTWYLKLDESGNTVGMAPAISGDITFTDNGDDTYTIAFECTDDAGYVWSGEWTGELSLSGNTSSVSTLSSKRSAISKQEISAKTAEMKAAKEPKVKAVFPTESRTDAVSKTFKSKN